MTSNCNTVYQQLNWAQDDLIVFIQVSMSSDSDFSQAWCSNIYSSAAFTCWTYLVRLTCPDNIADNIALAAPVVHIYAADISLTHLPIGKYPFCC